MSPPSVCARTGWMRMVWRVSLTSSGSFFSLRWMVSFTDEFTGPRIDRVARISGLTQWSSPRLRSGDADRLRASQLQHAVQNHDGDGHLGRLTLLRARAQPVADHPFEAADRGLR